MRAQWEREKEQAQGLGKLTERLDEARTELERAERELDYQRAAELRHGEIPELERKLAEADSREVADESPPSTCASTSTPTTSPRSWRSGPASPSRA